MATACFRLLTFFRPPDFNVPCLYSRITLAVFALPLDFDPLDFDDDRLLDDVFFAISFSMA